MKLHDTTKTENYDAIVCQILLAGNLLKNQIVEQGRNVFFFHTNSRSHNKKNRPECTIINILCHFMQINLMLDKY